MTFEQLKYFHEVVLQKSINKGAKASNLSYQAMLKSMNNLEAELNVTLLYRNNSGIVLTPEGESFFKDVKIILEMYDNWMMLGKRNMSHVAIYGTIFMTNYHAKNIKNLLVNKNYSVEYSSCYSNVIVQLIRSLCERRAETIFLTSDSVEKISIQQLAKNNGYICEQLLADSFLVYINRSFLRKLCINDNERKITLSDLNNIPRIQFEDLQDNFSAYQDYRNISNASNVVTVTNYNEYFSVLKQTEGYFFHNKSVAKYIENNYPYIKGVDVENFAPKLNYYIVYSVNATQDTLIAVDLIKKYFQDVLLQN